jgi:hypothetical protein
MEQRKRKIVPVVAVELSDPNEGDRIPKPKWCGVWIELGAVCLVVLAIVANVSFWKNWFVESDNQILMGCLLLGTCVSLARVRWVGLVTGWRLVLGLALWSLAIMVMILVLSASEALPAGTIAMAIGLVIAGWGALRVHGENWGYGPGLGIAWSLPAAISYLSIAGQFDRLETTAVRLTAGLADTLGLFHIRDNNSVFFGLGVAEHFGSHRVYDSAITFLGFAVFLILARRRNLLASIGTVVCSLVVWVTVRSLAWTLLVYWSEQTETWHGWNLQVGICMILVGAFLTMNLDQLVAAFLEPIPFEFVNPDFPLIAMTWNWMSGLPTLYLSVPERERDFGSFEEAVSK